MKSNRTNKTKFRKTGERINKDITRKVTKLSLKTATSKKKLNKFRNKKKKKCNRRTILTMKMPWQ